MDFVAVDFETSNEKRNSPCSIGIVVVKESKVIEKLHYLIKPKEMRFLPMNIWIHGIREEDVINELEFNELWPKIKHHFENSLVIAHNASFDISVLRNTLSLYNIEAPEFNYICTMKLAKNFYTNLDNAKLNTVNDYLGFEFKHHDALDDSLACANILLNISKELKINDINDISNDVGVTLGNVTKNGYKPSSTKGNRNKISSKEKSYKKSIYDDVKINALEHKTVVFTGSLGSMSREEAMRLVRKLGGTAGSSVTKKTNLLVTAVKNLENLNRGQMSNKLKKAMDLKDSGQNINFISEEEFLQMIK